MRKDGLADFSEIEGSKCSDLPAKLKYVCATRSSQNSNDH